MSAIDFRHRGTVRGGSNSYARLHLHLHPDAPRDERGNIPEAEAQALAEALSEKFPGLQFRPWVGLWAMVNTRREFALVPAVVRWATAAGWDVSLTIWDVGPKGEVRLSADPETFWRELAAAALWYDPAG